MANDDLVRIVYRPQRMKDTPPDAKGTGEGKKASTRRGRTSISMDPDLYATFVLIEGDARTARTKLRKWATEADGSREHRTELTGVSRLVHKKMLQSIRELVEAGLTVKRQEGPAVVVTGAPAAGADSDDVGAAWDSFKASEKPKRPGKKVNSAKNSPGKKGRSDGAAPGAGSAADAGKEDPFSPGAPASTKATIMVKRPGTGLDGLILAGDDAHVREKDADVQDDGKADTTWTRVRDEDAAPADPFMG